MLNKGRFFVNLQRAKRFGRTSKQETEIKGQTDRWTDIYLNIKCCQEIDLVKKAGYTKLQRKDRFTKQGSKGGEGRAVLAKLFVTTFNCLQDFSYEMQRNFFAIIFWQRKGVAKVETVSETKQ